MIVGADVRFVGVACLYFPSQPGFFATKSIAQPVGARKPPEGLEIARLRGGLSGTADR
jgi:hypothetical protein